MALLIARELKKLGLTDKEAKVYLAALELGYAPIQDIAKKAAINRATTYVIMDSLIQKGIAAHFNKGKKRFFVAESPDQLLGLLRVQEREIEERKREFERILPELRTLHNLSENKPKVLYYEGVEGIRSIQAEILRSKCGATYGIGVPEDWFRLFPRDAEEDYDRRRRAANIASNVVYVSKAPLANVADDALTTRAWLPSDHFRFESDFAVFNDTLVITTLRGNLSSVIITNAFIANTVRAYYNALLNISKKQSWKEKDWQPTTPLKLA